MVEDTARPAHALMRGMFYDRPPYRLGKRKDVFDNLSKFNELLNLVSFDRSSVL
jgi:hypothetical protein